MKILVTGSKGFIGRNLIHELRNRGYDDILEYDIHSGKEILDSYANDCEFVFHLAGVNRPNNLDEYMDGNYGFTSVLLDCLKKHANRSPILITSSIQAEMDNPYGVSKKAGEDLLLSYAAEKEIPVHIFRLPNVFGKWCKPNYNSVIATFCHNIANNLPIQINDPNVIMKLVYVDDVIEAFINTMNCKVDKNGDFCCVTPVYIEKLGVIADLIYSFRDSRDNFCVPNMADSFTKKLYSTYTSYLPKDSFSYPLKMNIDSRGSFTEFIKTSDRGQISINISKPGIIKGNHWHHTKCEKFLVVSGSGMIRFRRLDSEEIMEYIVSGDRLEVVDIPVGYTHNIINTGKCDMVTIMWANELFDKEKPDTYFLEV